MDHSTKKSQLQIRVTGADKAAIQSAAQRAGMGMSTYVLSKVLSAGNVRLRECIAACAEASTLGYGLAELNSFLASLTPPEFRDAVACAPEIKLTPFAANYVAAMIEYGCARCGISTPAWTGEIAPLTEPIFGTSLESLRLHLLTHSPAPFRRRNIFIDATLGDRV